MAISGKACLLAFLAVLATGCGTQTREGRPHVTKPEQPVHHQAAKRPERFRAMAEESDDSGGSGSTIFFGDDEGDALPAQERYAVFGRPAADDDRVAAGIARANGYVGRGDPLGRPIYNQTRLVAGTPE